MCCSKSRECAGSGRGRRRCRRPLRGCCQLHRCPLCRRRRCCHWHRHSSDVPYNRPSCSRAACDRSAAKWGCQRNGGIKRGARGDGGERWGEREGTLLQSRELPTCPSGAAGALGEAVNAPPEPCTIGNADERLIWFTRWKFRYSSMMYVVDDSSGEIASSYKRVSDFRKVTK
jgi:hypothetical protein